MRFRKGIAINALILILICCFCATFMKQNDANAYFHTNKNKTAQCFAVSYELSKYTEGTEYMSQGEKVNTDTMSYNNYATDKICAYIDKDGKVTGNLVYSGKRPPDTSAISGYPKLSLTSDKKGIMIHYCSNGGNNCKLDFDANSPVNQGSPAWETDNPTSNKVVTAEFKINNYNTFYDLAKAVNDAAQNKYLGGTKQALKDSNGNEIATGITDAKDEVVAEKDKAKTDSDNPVCYANSGALGWVLCPIITMASGVGEGMWNQIEEYHMKIPAQKVFESGGGVETAWSAVRDIANVVFIILFLFVIFSQLTGIGIDNYGIKKILPKLIVVAVLMNLSYIICELAVDVSNILGMSLNGLLSSQADAMNMERAMDDAASNAAGSIGLALGGGAVAFFTFLKEGSLLGAAGSIGLAVAGIVLIIVIAMLILYVILTIREAGIIMAVVVAPVALVCYMLPNTEKIYKKWFDIFKALLLVYPICGAMVGAGQLAGAVLSTIDNSSMKVAAAIVQVVPFFLIPVVLKNSLALMGNVGARLSSLGRTMGRRASGGLQGAVKSTERYKQWQENQRQVAEAGRAQNLIDRLNRRSGGDRTRLSRLQQARLFAAEKAVNEQNAREAEAEVGAVPLSTELAAQRARSAFNTQERKAFLDQYEGMSHDQLMEEAGFVRNANGGWRAGTVNWAGDRNADQRMSALVTSMESKGMETDMFHMLEHNDAGDATRQALAGSKNKVARAYGKRGAGQSFSQYMEGSGVDANGQKLDGIKEYVKGKGADFLNDIDDKSLEQIEHYSNAGNQIMENELISEAQAKVNDQNAVNILDRMAETYGATVSSGEQFINWNDSSRKNAFARADAGDARVQNALLSISEAYRTDPSLLSKLDNQTKTELNRIRQTYGQNLELIP